MLGSMAAHLRRNGDSYSSVGWARSVLMGKGVKYISRRGRKIEHAKGAKNLLNVHYQGGFAHLPFAELDIARSNDFLRGASPSTCQIIIPDALEAASCVFILIVGIPL